MLEVETQSETSAKKTPEQMLRGQGLDVRQREATEKAGLEETEKGEAGEDQREAQRKVRLQKEQRQRGRSTGGER